MGHKLQDAEEDAKTNRNSAVYVERTESLRSSSLLWKVDLQIIFLSRS